MLRFADKRDMENSYAAWRLETPTPYSTVCVTKAKVAKLPGPKRMAFLNSNQKIKQPFKYYVISLMSEIMADAMTLHVLDATGRVKRFLQKHPDLFERTPKKSLIPISISLLKR